MPERRQLGGLTITEQTAPATPPTGHVSIYALADGKMYAKDDTGAETALAGGAGGTTILNGSGAPDIATGAVGNYYEDTLNGTLYGPKTAGGWGTQQRPTVAAAPTSTNSSYLNAGCRYRFGRTGRVVGCRYQRFSGSPAVQTIQAWRDSNTTKVTEIADNQGAVTGTFTVTFPTPVLVAMNETWTFSYSIASGGVSRLNNVQAVTNTADVFFLEYRQNGVSNTYPDGVPSNTFYVEPLFEPNDAWPFSVRSLDPELDALSALTSAADMLPYYTGKGAAALTQFTGQARSLLDDGTAAAMRTTLGVPATTEAAPIRRLVTSDTTTAFAPNTGHENAMVTLSNAAAITVTMPSNATQGFAIGAEVDFEWLGVGQPTFVAGSGATLYSPAGTSLRARYSKATAKKIAANDWVLYGDLSGVVDPGSMGFVNHGATAGTARPTGYACITWRGSVEPTNMLNDVDLWVDTTP